MTEAVIVSHQQPAVAPPFSPALVALRAELDDAARDLARGARSANTLDAYDRDWTAFQAWCEQAGETPMPASPETVARYIAALIGAGLRPATVERYVLSVAVRHRMANVTNPAAHEAVRAVMRGVRRLPTAAPRKKAPLTTDLIVRVFADFDPADPTDQRDRVVILFAYAAALRRSEIVALDVQYVTVDVEGLRLWIARSKTDQRGDGEEVGIVFGAQAATCPVLAWQTWRRTLAAAGHTSGPAFRAVSPRGRIPAERMSDRTVANIIKRRVAAVGLDPSDFAGHSGRRGYATAAARAGAPDRAIMKGGRWTSRATMEGYIAPGRLFDDNASAKLGL